LREEISLLSCCKQSAHPRNFTSRIRWVNNNYCERCHFSFLPLHQPTCIFFKYIRIFSFTAVKIAVKAEKFVPASLNVQICYRANNRYNNANFLVARIFTTDGNFCVGVGCHNEHFMILKTVRYTMINFLASFLVIIEYGVGIDSKFQC
jgi:hypothetical protein